MPSPRNRPRSHKRQIVIAYVPALHSGYKKLFDNHPDAVIYVIDTDVVSQFDELRKDLRALEPSEAVKALEGWGRKGMLADETSLKNLGSDTKALEITMPDEDLSHELAKKFFAKSDVVFESIFLRWDRRRMEGSKDEISADRVVSKDRLDTEMMSQAADEAKRSTNFWRRVGAVISKEGKIALKASNRTQPSPNANWIDGDPRINANRGVSIDLTNDMHAEALLIARAAKEGIALAGTSMYVTVFPCPTCAKLIANSGISKLFFAEGYAILDGEEVLKANSVQIFQVRSHSTNDNSDIWKPYPKKE